MSFSMKVKQEISVPANHGRHCQIAELLALVLAVGEVEFAGDQIKLILKLENELIADKIIFLLEHLFGKEMIVCREQKYIVIENQEMADQVLRTIKLLDYVDYIGEDWLDEDELLEMDDEMITYVSSRGVSLQNCQFPNQVIQKDCCKRAFLKGMFLASGSVNDPNKAYHFEIVVRNMEMAKALQDVMQHFSLEAKIVKRKKYYVVYLKEGSMIVDILNIMEAYVSLMDMENVRILKDIRNDVNRQINCEMANIKKTVNASRRQIEAIQYIERTKGLKFLSASLRELAELRLEQPEANLSELGEMLNPPVSKSGVNHRLRKICEIANTLKEGNQI